MKSILLGVVSFLFLQVGGGGGGGTTHCVGCDDTSALPEFYDQQIGNCISYTTASLTNWRSGDCTQSGAVCVSDPCHPELVLTHHQASNGDGVTFKGIVGDVTFGPIKMPGGEDVEIYRGGVTLACGATSPYYFEITGHCSETNNVEEVYGWFSCSSCVRE